jgi:hypothetical protein
MKSQLTNRMVALLILAIGTLVIAGCGQNPGQADSSTVTVFNPPETSFAKSLGIEGGPVTAEQAKQVAEVAAGGIAVSAVEQEDQDGTQVFGVLIQSGSAQKDVKVRISDGAVTQIDDGGPDGPGSED